jgi:hypothetical protein
MHWILKLLACFELYMDKNAACMTTVHANYSGHMHALILLSRSQLHVEWSHFHWHYFDSFD